MPEAVLWASPSHLVVGESWVRCFLWSWEQQLVHSVPTLHRTEVLKRKKKEKRISWWWLFVSSDVILFESLWDVDCNHLPCSRKDLCRLFQKRLFHSSSFWIFFSEYKRTMHKMLRCLCFKQCCGIRWFFTPDWSATLSGQRVALVVVQEFGSGIKRTMSERSCLFRRWGLFPVLVLRTHPDGPVGMFPVSFTEPHSHTHTQSVWSYPLRPVSEQYWFMWSFFLSSCFSLFIFFLHHVTFGD